MKPLEYPINTEIYYYLPYYSEWRPHEGSNSIYGLGNHKLLLNYKYLGN